jgi:hypothetical protein
METPEASSLIICRVQLSPLPEAQAGCRCPDLGLVKHTRITPSHLKCGIVEEDLGLCAKFGPSAEILVVTRFLDNLPVSWVADSVECPSGSAKDRGPVSMRGHPI